MGAPSAVRIEREGAVLAIVLARPQIHDAFDDAMIAELTRAFREAAADAAARVVVLRSTGKSFCAGADLEWMKRLGAATREQNVRDAGLLEDMFRAIATCPKPVVARLHGAAFGGGAGLVAACDLAIASTEAKLGFTEVRLGILPAVISPYVVRKTGPGVAQALFLTGEIVSAQRAQEIGLVHRVVPPIDLDSAVDAAVFNLLAGGSRAHAAVKALVAGIEGRTLDEARAITTAAIADARSGDEGQEGLAAFLEKRKPRWSPGG
jgi:methylglutaconyl-CoA hydratase